MKLFLIGAIVLLLAGYSLRRDHVRNWWRNVPNGAQPAFSQRTNPTHIGPEVQRLTNQGKVPDVGHMPSVKSTLERPYLPPVPTEEELEEQRRTNYLSTSSDDLITYSSDTPGGGVYLDLEGRFQQITKAKIHLSGDETNSDQTNETAQNQKQQ